MSVEEKAELFGLNTRVPTIDPQLTVRQLLFDVDLGNPLEGLGNLLPSVFKNGKKGPGNSTPSQTL